MNVERLLGSLISGALSSRPRRRSSRGARRLTGRSGAKIGMGLLGLALGAYEHYSKQSAARTAAQPGSEPPPPPPEGLESPDSHARADETLLLLRAMIAAAYADGQLDAEERTRILTEAERGGLSAEERSFLEAELERPCAPESLAEQAKAKGLVDEVYASSIIAIAVDTEAEKAYLARLAVLLGLSPQSTAQWHQELGVE